MKLLGLSGRMGSGKSTLAAYIERVRPDAVRRTSFAQPIKAIGSILGGVHSKGDVNKQAMVPTLADAGITWRRLYQMIGTDFGRVMLSPDIWVRLAKMELDKLQGNPELVIFDDVRFENELQFIRSRGGKVYRIIREDLPLLPENSHASEWLPDVALCDGVIYNNSTLDELNEKAYFLALELGLYSMPPRGGAPEGDDLEGDADAVEARGCSEIYQEGGHAGQTGDVGEGGQRSLEVGPKRG